MSSLIRGRAGPLSEVVAEAAAAARRAAMLAEMAWLMRQGPYLQAANRAEDTRDKSYVTEQRLNALWNHLGPVIGGGDGQRTTQVTTSNPQTISSTSQVTANNLITGATTITAGTWHVSGRLSCTIGGIATTIKLAIQGPAISSMEVGFWKAQNNPGGPTLFTATQVAINTLIQPFTVNEGAGNGFTVVFDGIIVFSAGGQMSLAVAEAVSGSAWNLNINSYWTFHSVGQTT